MQVRSGSVAVKSRAAPRIEPNLHLSSIALFLLATATEDANKFVVFNREVPSV